MTDIERFIAERGVTKCPPGTATADTETGIHWKRRKGYCSGPSYRSRKGLQEKRAVLDKAAKL